MVVCAACLTESPDGSRFCPACGHALAGPEPANGVVEARSAARLEERKVVSVLFCDLVGFTAMSEAADPEDVDRVLEAYARMARSAIVAHGGVVEKFIGDAVVGVFGVPATHEDDALRAVRAGLAICDGAGGLQALGGTTLRLRVGVNTGGALVRLDVAPESGERFMTGDAINTASRIQSVAPEQGVAVGEVTWQATRPTVEYVDLPPATLKGKKDPVRVFQATGLRTTLGTDPSRSHAGAYVGRAAELGRLRALFDRAAADGRGGFVLVVGEPGIGKSRIVAELRRHAQTVDPRMIWRSGRCLPYGDGVTFWALGEIVKAHAGILDGDDPAVATAKLNAILPVSAERNWLRGRLLPLVGIEGASVSGREEAFAAWRQFLHGLAATGPAVVVIEDLHWADEALQGFVADLSTHLDAVPLLLVGTARPELLAGNAGPLAIAASARIDLGPLLDAETGAFVEDLLGMLVPEEIRGAILERAEGNPLFAEEYVRLLDDRGLLDASDGAVRLRSGATLPVPDSIGALLAARLDTLPRARKAVLADASVVGHVFWAGTVASMGERDRESVLTDVDELARLEFVRHVEPSSMVGESEAAFWHILGRDVAYAQLPRASRATRHVAAAAWLEAKAGERVEDIAEVLAHHYTTALELAEATGDAEFASSIRPMAARLLRLSGDRALGLDTQTAVVAYQRSLELIAGSDASRYDLLEALGVALFQAGRYAESVDALRAAVTGFDERGDERRAAMAMLDLSMSLGYVGPTATEVVGQAVVILERSGPSADLVEALTHRVWDEFEAGRNDDALATAERAVDMAAELHIDVPPAALARRGSARAELGDRRGIDDLRAAIALATSAGLGREAAIDHCNLAVYLWLMDGPGPAIEVLRAGITFARGCGLAGVGRLLSSMLSDYLVDAGEVDAAEEAGLSILRAMEEADDVALVAEHLVILARIAWLRGFMGAAVATVQRASTYPNVDRPPSRLINHSTMARILADAGDHDAARRLLTDVADPSRPQVNVGSDLRAAIPAAVAIGDLEIAERLLDRHHTSWTYVEHQTTMGRARVAEARGQFDEAASGFADVAERWATFGSVPDEADAQLGLGRCLVALGRLEEARRPLERASALYGRMGAVPAKTDADSLLVRVTVSTPGIEAPAGDPAGA